MQGSTTHVSFCCSNNRISALGALSLGLGLRVNQTLRMLVVSANLMGEAPHRPACVHPHRSLLRHISPPQWQQGTQVPERQWCGALLASSCDHFFLLPFTHPSLAWPMPFCRLLPLPPSLPAALPPSQPTGCCSAEDGQGTLASPSSSPLLFLWPCWTQAQTYLRPWVHSRGSFLQGCQWGGSC